MSGICPKCENAVTRLAADVVSVSVGAGHQTLKGVTFNCPVCHTVLGCQIDPITIRDETISAVVKGVASKL